MPAADWFLWLMGLALLVTMSGLVYWAWRSLFRDRAAGRRRCPRCWYDMAYSPGMTCAECGFTARREAQLGRTRRRYVQAATAILMCAAIALWVNYQLSSSGWASIMPTKVLILSMPLSDADGDTFKELRRRMLLQQLTDFELMMFLKRCVSGDWWARPPGSDSETEWVEKYGSELNRWRRMLVMRGELTGYDRSEIDVSAAPYNDFERLLLDLPPVLQLTLPSQWPPHVQPRLQVRLRHWWPSGSEARIHITREDDPENVITLIQHVARPGVNFGAMIGGIDPAATEVRFRVSVERRRPGLDEPWQPVSERLYSLPVKVTEDAEWPTPATEPEMLEIVKRVFSGQVVRWPAGPVPVRFRYDSSPTMVSEMKGVAVALSMQLKRGDEIARQLNIWWLGGSANRREWPRGIGWEVAYENAELLSELTSDDERWHIVIASRPELATLAGKAERYWEGSFTVPVQLIEVNSPAPSPEWRRTDRPGD